MLAMNMVVCFACASAISMPLTKHARATKQLASAISMPLTKHARATNHARKRNLRAADGIAVLSGSAAFDYKMDVQIGNQTFSAVVDTGSSDFAVVASANIGCETFYSGTCGGSPVTEQYGSGSWSGNVCENNEDQDVIFAGLDAGPASFVGVEKDTNFFRCESADPFNAIVGLGFSDLSNDGVGTLLDQVWKTNSNISKIFSMQCCGYDGTKQLGTGSLVVGGVDSNFYTGEFSFTPLTRAAWYCVDMEDVLVGGASITDGISSSASSCDTIVDSGTSSLQLSADVYERFMSELPATYNPQTCIKGEQLGEFPDITISLAGGVTLNIPPTLYTQPAPLSAVPSSTGFANLFGRGISSDAPVSDCRSLYVSKAPSSSAGVESPSNILGQVVMEGYYTVFDQDNMRVGFATIAGCGANPSDGTIDPLGGVDCNQPGSNCGHPTRSTTESAGSFSQLWNRLSTGWRILIIILIAIFGLSCLYLVWSGPSIFCSRRSVQRPNTTVTQGAVVSNARNDLACPLSPTAVNNPAMAVDAWPAAAVVAPTAPSFTATQQQAIDPSWQAISDPSTGQTYYINPTTGRATWNFPAQRTEA